MPTPTSIDGKHSAAKGSMPATEDIPEIPQFPVYVTHEMTEEMDLLYVSSEHEKIRMPEFDHLIVRCSICGYESVGVGMTRGTAFEDQNMHFASRHLGSKTVWNPEAIPNRDDVLDLSHVVRETSSTSGIENAWDSYAFRARGDCPDETAAEIATERLDGKPTSLLIEHHPPTKPYAGSPEKGIEPEIRKISAP